MSVQVRRDRKRGCGWRKPGGLYLVALGLMRVCARLPMPCTVCPTCHAGIKPTRSWTWIDADALLKQSVCLEAPACDDCPLARPFGRAGLLWIGEQFYATPADWIRESTALGISRRISAVPKDFKVGKTWVLVAHRKAIPLDDGTSFCAGIFHAFRPLSVEYVVRGDQSADDLEAMEKRGITPVRIERDESEPVLPMETARAH